jgi:hypothetical protein
MPVRTARSGSELFIVDNSDTEWKVAKYLHDWCQISSAIDVATAYFEIGSLLALDNEWQKVDQIRILMGDEVSKRTKTAFAQGLDQIRQRLDASLESEKQKNDFWTEEAGRSAWYLYDLATENILDDPARIVELIRCKPDTPRHCTIDQPTLGDIRGKIEKHIKNTYLKSVQAPIGVAPVLKAWMELS